MEGTHQRRYWQGALRVTLRSCTQLLAGLTIGLAYLRSPSNMCWITAVSGCTLLLRCRRAEYAGPQGRAVGHRQPILVHGQHHQDTGRAGFPQAEGMTVYACSLQS